MAQLIKIRDFVSRYEKNMYRYPSQYIRLKKRHWNKLKGLWEEGLLVKDEVRKEQLTEKKRWFSKFKGRLKYKETEQVVMVEAENMDPSRIIPEGLTDGWEVTGVPVDDYFTHIPKDENELKQRFLNQLIEFQIRWASSTIREKSYVERELFANPKLKYYLQRFPDNYLVLYHPVFLIQKAPIELDVIMISPIETLCITLAEGKEDSVFYGSKERFWVEKHQNDEKKTLNPLLAVNRMDNVIKRIYDQHSIDLPIRKIVLNRTGYIDYPYAPIDMYLIDKRNYEDWFASKRRMSSPIKHVQLKAAKVLLQYCQTTSVVRPEWDSSTQ